MLSSFLWPMFKRLYVVWIAAFAISFSRTNEGFGGIGSHTGTTERMCEPSGHETNESESVAIVARSGRSGSPSCYSLSPTWREAGNENNVQ